MLTRAAFFLENQSLYQHLPGNPQAWSIVWGGLYFDTAAIAYTNALYVLLVLLPCHFKETPLWQKCCKWLFVVVNGLALAMNLGDSVYFQYTARRTTIAFFSEFGGDDKLGSIVALEFVRHWYLVLLFLVLMALLWLCYCDARRQVVPLRRLCGSYAVGAGGRATLLGRHAWRILGQPSHQAEHRQSVYYSSQRCVAHSEHALLHDTHHWKERLSQPRLSVSFADETELVTVYSPIQNNILVSSKFKVLDSPRDSSSTRKNVVVIFLESFAREYFGSLNKEVLPGYRGYTPFLDSLMNHAVSFRYTYANGRSSIDAMPSALCGLPMFVESFVAASHANNHLEGMANCLSRMGYQTAFFHGAPASSLGFQGFTKSTGFKHCFSQEDFEADPAPRRGRLRPLVGHLGRAFPAIFPHQDDRHEAAFHDHPLHAYKPPPLSFPSSIKKFSPKRRCPFHKCIRYTDHALRRFSSEAAGAVVSEYPLRAHGRPHQYEQPPRIQEQHQPVQHLHHLL